MELRHLRYFLAVAEELHFRKAAERLHIAQPPLSLQIAQLELLLGARLFDRAPGKSVHLTPAGRVLLEDSRRILDLLDQAKDRVTSASRGEIGRLTIGMTSSMAYGIVPALLQQFRAENPGIDFRLVEMTTAQQEHEILNRSLDLGFCYSPLEHPAFQTTPVASEHLVVALSETHSLSARRRIPLSGLRHQRLLSFPRRLSPGLYDLMQTECRAAGISPVIAEDATQLQTIIALVCAGLGIAIVPESMSTLTRAGVVYRALAGVKSKVETLLVCRLADANPALSRLIALIKRNHRARIALQ